VPSSDVIKIRPGPYVNIFHALLSEQEAVLESVRVLESMSRRRLANDAVIEDTEE
jgi:hypothetical protein